MQYRKNKNGTDALSVLGFGCMRFTHKAGSIDQDKAEREMKRALDLGVNYFDTAYVYPGSEVCLGRFIRRYDCRSSLYIATKLPHYRVKSGSDFDRYFDEECTRLQTDYVDYYLMHMMNDKKSWERLVHLGILDWIADQKASGRIRHIGFSFHGGTKSFQELLDAYDWDFCQIQFNYMDEHSQAGVEGLNYAGDKGIPVVIMEPLRGGRLVSLPPKARAEFDRMPQKRSAAEWGLRWIWNHPAVTVVLSGMNDISQVEENCRIAGESKPNHLSREELAVYPKVLQAIYASQKVGCTGCNYCQPCPQGVDIPGCFSTYNNSYANGFLTGFREYLMCTVMRKDKTNAGRCIACGACERHCPQHIRIRKELQRVRRRFEGPVFQVGKRIIDLVMRY